MPGIWVTRVSRNADRLDAHLLEGTAPESTAMRQSRWSMRGTKKQPHPLWNYARSLALPAVVASITLLSVGPAAAQAVNTDFAVTDGSVEAIAKSGNTLYIGGTFTRVGPATGGAAPLSVSTGAVQGVPKVVGTVEAVCSDGAGGWYIGGTFTRVNGHARSNLAHLDSQYGVTSWAPEAGGDVYAIVVRGGIVYVGGTFTSIGGQPRNRIAAIQAGGTGVVQSWNPDADLPVYALAVSGGRIFAAGSFFSIGGQSRSRIAALSVSTGLATPWNPGADGPVYSLAIGNAVYAGGSFANIGGSMRNGIAALDTTASTATAWNPNSNGTVYALAIAGSTIYTGGDFSFIGGQSRNQIAAINAASGLASSWNPTANGTVYTLAISDSTIFAGGTFTFIGGQPRNFIAALSDLTGLASSWNPSSPDFVREIAVAGTTLFAGGSFTTIGASNRSRIAAINVNDGMVTAWNPNAGGTVNAIAISGNVVYAGGGFTSIGGQPRGRIGAVSALNGLATPFNPNSSGPVLTLAVGLSTVYAGGAFITIGGSSRSNIAALDATTGAATSWNPGATGTVQKLLLSGGNVYACGSFSTLGGASRYYVGAVDVTTGLATSWNPNPDNWVHTMALVGPSTRAAGGTMYLGGDFLFVGGQSRYKLAAVDASTGTVLPWRVDANNEVRAIATAGAKVFAGGAFSALGGVLRSRVGVADGATGQTAAWDPSANGIVRSLLLDGATIYVGGEFSTIGPWPVRGIASISIPSSYDALVGPGWDVAGLQYGTGQDVEVVSDGAGGMLTIWATGDTIANDLKALRLAADGRIAPGWSPGGLVLCDAVDRQPIRNLGSYEPRLASVVPDGKGGMVAAWFDARGASIGVSAQRVSGAGQALWTTNGVTVGPSGVAEMEVTLVPTGDGGAIVAWTDAIDGNNNVYASRLLPSGATASGWGGSRGAPVITQVDNQAIPAAVSDGKGGAIISWHDDRAAEGIYAQRLGPGGNRLWSSAGVVVCSEDNSQTSARMVPDGSGGAIVWWHDFRSGGSRLAAQRLDSLGTRRWLSTGVLLSPTGMVGGDAVSDGTGGAIFVWRLASAIYAQRVSAGGAIMWGPTGILLDETLGTPTQPTLVSDGNGGAIVTWESYGVYSMRIRPDGTTATGWAGGVAATSEPDTFAIQSWATPDGTGGTLIVWAGQSFGGKLYAQRINRNGEVAATLASAWVENGTPAATVTGVQQRPAAVSTGQGGTILVWEDYRGPSPAPGSAIGGPSVMGPGHALVTGIKLLDSGDVDPDWVDNGNQVAPSANNQLEPVAVSDNLGGALVAWTEVIGAGSDVRAQHILSNSVLAQGWPAGGLSLHTPGGVNSRPAIATDGVGGAIVVWERAGGGTGQDIVAQRVRANSQLMWGANGLIVSNANGNQTRPVVVDDGSGGAYFAWTDGRGPNTDIYGVHVDSTGTVVTGWTANGSAIVLAAGDQDQPAGISNGTGGAIFIWRDASSGTRDLYAQRSGDHTPQVWTSFGVAITTMNGDQGPARMAPDGVGGAIVAWEDSRAGSNGTDLYAMRVLEAGTVDAGWNATGVPLCLAVGNQMNTQVVADGQGGAVVFWEDDRSGAGLDIYAAGIQGNGTLDPRYPQDGLEVSTAGGSQTQMVLTTDGNGGALVAWNDGRGTDPDIFAMHLFGASVPSPLAVGDRPVHVLVALAPPWPNPSRGSVSFAFEIATASAVRLDILDVTGRRVKQLVREERASAGAHVQRWDGRNNEGGPVAAGIYFAQLRVGSHAVTRRFALTR
jgi:trimeric autotransporter adhesin